MDLQYLLSLTALVCFASTAKAITNPDASGKQQSKENNGGSKLQTAHIVGIAIGAFIVTAVIVCVIIAIIYCCIKQRRKTSRKRVDFEKQPLLIQTTKERKREEAYERHNARLSVEYFVATNRQYGDVVPLPDMGSRMQKYWFKAESSFDSKSKSEIQTHTDVTITIAPISKHCPLLPLNDETVKQLNGLMATLKQHQFIQPIERIEYISDRKQAIIVQPFMSRGSLKDIIYNIDPNKDWADKYPTCTADSETGLPATTVATYGWQILKAMRFLYKQGFPVLGHVQSGNIFVSQDGVCRLGGYENTLLGYRSRFYRMCREHLEHMDTIMFGHLVFEMSCAKEMITLAPTEDDYQEVKDDSVREVLRFIFADKFPDIKAVKGLSFFQAVSKSEKEKKATKLKQVKEALKSVGSQLMYNKIWAAVKHSYEDEKADQHSSPNQRRPQK